MQRAPEPGCRKPHDVVRWHDEQAPERWFAGRVWHFAQVADDFGCVNAQETPVFLWQLAHAPVRWLAGLVWHFSHAADDFGCVNAQEAPVLRWHVEHWPERCLAGALWHEAHWAPALVEGWWKANVAPGLWQVVHEPVVLASAPA